MAEVAKETRDRIDALLAQSVAAWEELPEAESEFADFDEVEKLDYVYEWPLEEERLSKLESYAQDGLMSVRQAEQYEDLKRLVGKNRPVLERIHARLGL